METGYDCARVCFFEQVSNIAFRQGIDFKVSKVFFVQFLFLYTDKSLCFAAS